jgi:hypothetical protein
VVGWEAGVAGLSRDSVGWSAGMREMGMGEFRNTVS